MIAVILLCNFFERPIMKIHTLIAAIALTVGGAAFAQAPAASETPKIDRRQASQDQRIDQGVTSGSLTARESAKLRARQDNIARDEAAAKADGVVTKAERRKLTREQNHASAAIYRQKHDRQNLKPVAK